MGRGKEGNFMKNLQAIPLSYLWLPQCYNSHTKLPEQNYATTFTLQWIWHECNHITRTQTTCIGVVSEELLHTCIQQTSKMALVCANHDFHLLFSASVCINNLFSPANQWRVAAKNKPVLACILRRCTSVSTVSILSACTRKLNE